MTRPILPLADELLGANKRYITANRPTAAAHVENGKWSALLQGFRSQEQIALARVAKEVAAARVPTASGEDLYELLRSEFDAEISDEPTKAIGTIALFRSFASSTTQPGLIRKGTKFRRPADTTRQWKEAIFESIEPVFVGIPDDSYINGEIYRVKVQAVTAGASANTPKQKDVASSSFFALSDALCDPAFVVYDGDAAGGSDNLDTKLKQLGKHLSLGQYGPNMSAIDAGLLSAPGVSRIATTENLTNGGVIAWIGDDSWSCSTRLQDVAMQSLKDDWLGFGGKISLGSLVNYPISVMATVVLRSKRFTSDTTEIYDNIRSAVQSYFNDRLDWYTWTIDGLVSAIVRSDWRILCVLRRSSANVSCSVHELTGDSISEPAKALPSSAATTLYHWDVSASNVKISFTSPQATSD